MTLCKHCLKDGYRRHKGKYARIQCPHLSHYITKEMLDDIRMKEVKK